MRTMGNFPFASFNELRVCFHCSLRSMGFHSQTMGFTILSRRGVGGLGHLGIQFASKMGFKTIAIGRGKDKEELVRKLGARYYIDSKSQNPVEELVKLGGRIKEIETDRL